VYNLTDIQVFFDNFDINQTIRKKKLILRHTVSARSIRKDYFIWITPFVYAHSILRRRNSQSRIARGIETAAMHRRSADCAARARGT